MDIKKKITTAAAVILTLGATLTGVFAANVDSEPIIEPSDAVKAADVCEAHLKENCNECDGYDLNAYAVYCPHCGARTTLCCSRDCAYDDYEEKCFVNTHPSGCKTIQDLYWNAYICMDCGWYTIGTKSDDYHVEAYWHKKDSSCYDNAYCSMQSLDDLRAVVNAKTEVMSVNTAESQEHDPVAAGDYCDVHQVFECKIPHNDIK